MRKEFGLSFRRMQASYAVKSHHNSLADGRLEDGGYIRLVPPSVKYVKKQSCVLLNVGLHA
jgi:hypothetical protein